MKEYEAVQNNKYPLVHVTESCQAMWEIPKIITSIPTTVEMKTFIVVIITTIIIIAIFWAPCQTN